MLLIREVDSQRLFVKKVLRGYHAVYEVLKSYSNPYLPQIFEVTTEGESTIIVEEYIEGQSLGSAELSQKQLHSAVKELCSVLEFLHGIGIIHRDIKPSNIILANDGHIRLIDFDAARMPKDDLEQDTRLLGTRGYAPPEQYGFAQTDTRADIYSLGVTLKQLLGDKAHKPHYRRIIQKCTNLNPDKRYQSARQVKRALSYRWRSILYSFIAMLLISIILINLPRQPVQQEEVQSVSSALAILPAPENPHWNGDTGIGVWGNVPESGVEDQVAYQWRLYRQDTQTPPDLDKILWEREGIMRGNMNKDDTFSTYDVNLGSEFWKNGFYYFAVSAVGDGVNYADSPYVISNAFEYTGESAPSLPSPTGLEWKVIDGYNGLEYYATWKNLDDYVDTDTFNVFIYDEAGTMVRNNIWSKETIDSIGKGGVWLRPTFLSGEGAGYRFTVQAQTSRPNKYKSSPMPDPVPEEYFSPWYYNN